MIAEMAPRGLQEFIVLPIPNRLGVQPPGDDGQVRAVLVESDVVRGSLDRIGERPEDRSLEVDAGLGSVSPIVGRWPRAWR